MLTPVSPIARDSAGARKIVTSREVESLILEQVETLRTLASEVGLLVRFSSPTEPSTTRCETQEPVAQGVLLAARRLGLPLLGQPGTLLERLARGLDVRMIAEGFPDRRYRGPDALVPRSEAGAVLHDPVEIELQAVRLVKEGRAATLCVHGDEPGAVANADLMRQVLGRNRIVIRSFVNS